MENSLKFSEDKKTFTLVLAMNEGTETPVYRSKEKGFRVITALANNGNISPTDFRKFRDQILKTDELPWGEPKPSNLPSSILAGLLISSSSGFGLSGFDFGGPSRNFSELMSILDFFAVPDKPVDIAYLKMCDCGSNHGRIYCKKCYTTLLDSKEQATMGLNLLKERNEISDDEFKKIKAEIEASRLP
jgi:hypothetical protein